MSADVDWSLLKEVEWKAHHDEDAESRREFGRRYREMLDGIYAEIRAEADGYMDSTGESISCGKGCTHCCEHFISVPVYHGLVIADYLYASQKAMSVFQRGYESWRHAIKDNPQAASLFESLEAGTTSATEVLSPPQEILSEYHRLAIHCPFLDGKRCSIYPVRPICCAAFFAVSPAEHCRHDSPVPAVVFEVTPSQSKLQKLATLADPRLSWHQEPLPELVYKLLTRGFPEVAGGVQKLFEAEEKHQPPEPLQKE